MEGETLQEKNLDEVLAELGVEEEDKTQPPAADLASVVKARAAAGLCPKCGGQVVPTDQNCPTCRINLAWARENLDELAGAEEDKAELQLPAKMELFHRGSEIEIVRRWFGWDEVFLTAWAVGVGWLTFVAASKESLYFLLLGAVEILLVYRAIAGWLNRTHIVVSRDKITVRHGPLPWLGNKELEASDLSSCTHMPHGPGLRPMKYAPSPRMTDV